MSTNETGKAKGSPNDRITIFRQGVVAWFSYNGREFPWRRASCTKYVKIVSEILLRRTKAEMVASFLPGFINMYPSWKKLSSAALEILEKQLKPLGLAPTRSKALKMLAVELTRRHGRFPRHREELYHLPGVGQYAANAVLLFCFGEREPLLDTSMARVLERFFGPRQKSDMRFDPYLQQLARSIVDSEDPVTVNWAILDFSALVCKERHPRCFECPLATYCRSATQSLNHCEPSDEYA